MTGRYYFDQAGGHPFGFDYQLELKTLTPGSEAARDHRDIVLVSSTDRGASWSAKTRVNDDPPRYDNGFPRVVVDGRGRVHVAWYDRRDSPGCDDLVNAYWAQSRDGGVTFAPSVRLSEAGTFWLNITRMLRSSTTGDHLGLAASGEGAIALWMDGRGGDPSQIYGRRIGDLPTGIAVGGFAAEQAGERARLSWQVTTAGGVEGFQLHRSVDGGSYGPVGARVPCGQEGRYEAEDPLEPGHTYAYRLEVIGRDGSSTWEGPVEVTWPAAAKRLEWGRIGPNPFAAELVIELASPEEASGEVRVFDVTGHEVKMLHRGPIAAGLNRWVWHGSTAGGAAAPAGVYLVTARIGTDRLARRVVRMR